MELRLSFASGNVDLGNLAPVEEAYSLDDEIGCTIQGFPNFILSHSQAVVNLPLENKIQMKKF